MKKLIGCVQEITYIWLVDTDIYLSGWLEYKILGNKIPGGYILKYEKQYFHFVISSHFSTQ